MNSKERIAKKTDEVWSEAKAGKLGLLINGTYKPGCDTEYSALAGEAYMAMPSGSAYLSTGGIIATMHAISRTSENPERAMMLLEYLNTDKDVYNTLNFGIKDMHYTIDADGFMLKDGEGAKGYSPSVPWMFATNYLANVLMGQPKTIWEDTKKINESARVSNILGFNFDAENVTGEIGKCSTVVGEYSRAIELGVLDETRYEEFLAKLKEAGSEKIIAEMQSQLDAWKATR